MNQIEETITTESVINLGDSLEEEASSSTFPTSLPVANSSNEISIEMIHEMEQIISLLESTDSNLEDGEVVDDMGRQNLLVAPLALSKKRKLEEQDNENKIKKFKHASEPNKTKTPNDKSTLSATSVTKMEKEAPLKTEGTLNNACVSKPKVNSKLPKKPVIKSMQAVMTEWIRGSVQEQIHMNQEHPKAKSPKSETVTSTARNDEGAKKEDSRRNGNRSSHSRSVERQRSSHKHHSNRSESFESWRERDRRRTRNRKRGGRRSRKRAESDIEIVENSITFNNKLMKIKFEGTVTINNFRGSTFSIDNKGIIEINSSNSSGRPPTLSITNPGNLNIHVFDGQNNSGSSRRRGSNEEVAIKMVNNGIMNINYY